MKTDFAASERRDLESIKQEFEKILHDNHTAILLNAIPNYILILNEYRQIVFVNDSLKSYLDSESIESLIGNRPGELLKCVNSKLNEGGCGTSSKCRYCGAVNSIIESQKKNIQVSDECCIIAEIENEFKVVNFKVTTSPIKFNNSIFYISILEDISIQKRKHSLEKIFFHDVMNTASSIVSITKLLRKNLNNNECANQYIDMIDGLTRTLNEEIKVQRDLSDAELGILKLKPRPISSTDLIESIIVVLSNNKKSENKYLKVDGSFENIQLYIDIITIQRIINNMLLNALEASSDGDTVTIGCNKDNKTIRIWVKNGSFIPEEIQSKIFSRSFSTKGNDRGLGTYSMKLLGENYLKGKVNFISNPKDGTIFYIDLPTELVSE